MLVVRSHLGNRGYTSKVSCNLLGTGEGRVNILASLVALNLGQDMSEILQFIALNMVCVYLFVLRLNKALDCSSFGEITCRFY